MVEWKERRAAAITAGKGKNVPPVMSQSLTRLQMEALLRRRKQLSFHCFQMFSGLPVTLAEPNVPEGMMHLANGLYVTMDNCVQLRCFWENSAGILKPSGTGLYTLHTY